MNSPPTAVSPAMARRVLNSPQSAASPSMARRSIVESTSGISPLANFSNFSASSRRQNESNGSNVCMFNMGNAAYRANLVSHFSEDLERRRRAEKVIDECRSDAAVSEMLKIDTVEMYSRDNAREHRTDRYELIRDNNSMTPTTVLRRGQPFFMALRMKDRAFDPRRDSLRIVFNFGSSPQVTKSTKVVLPFRITQREFTRAPQCWDVRLHQQDSFIITLQIHVPASALVGLWRCSIETTSNSPGSRVEEFRCPDDIYILFNPFYRDDAVYLDSEELRREYIMNESGKVFVGTHHRPKGRKWIYGQFSDVALPTAQLLLEMSGLSPTERGNPVQVVRAISSIINSINGEGLLEGKWEGAFEDGVSPWVWTGSSKIFEKFLRNGCKPVKYGQCWVFAAVATTICRALGIPSRPVTNFVSARDTNHTMTIDKYFDVNGEEIKGGPDGDCKDSIWNFHSWTEVWMNRPDLPHGYSGWQAIDPTPQSVNQMMNTQGYNTITPMHDKMQCGPASVEAVRRGEVGFAFNTPIMFAEVNAEVQHFQEDESSHWGFKQARINNYHVGRQILTKRAGADDDVGESDAEDITMIYKNMDDMNRHQRSMHSPMHSSAHSTLHSPISSSVSSYSDRDHSAIMPFPGSSHSDNRLSTGSFRGSERNQQMYDSPNKFNDDVCFDLMDMDKIVYGQPFTVQIQIQNRSQESRTISIMLSAFSTYYTGNTARRLGRNDRQFVLQPGQRESMQIRVTWEEYRDKVVDYGMVKFYALANVLETKQTWSEEDDFQWEKPKLDIQIRGNCQVNQECYMTFSFLNPLPISLNECEFTFEGHGMIRPQKAKYRDVRTGEMVSHTQKFIPRQGGERKLVVVFNSRELIDVFGSKTIVVRD